MLANAKIVPSAPSGMIAPEGDNYIMVGTIDRAAWDAMFDMLSVVTCRLCYQHFRTSVKHETRYIICMKCQEALAKEEAPL